MYFHSHFSIILNTDKRAVKLRSNSHNYSKLDSRLTDFASVSAFAASSTFSFAETTSLMLWLL